MLLVVPLGWLWLLQAQSGCSVFALHLCVYEREKRNGRGVFPMHWGWGDRWILQRQKVFIRKVWDFYLILFEGGKYLTQKKIRLYTTLIWTCFLSKPQIGNFAWLVFHNKIALQKETFKVTSVAQLCQLQVHVQDCVQI